MAASEYHIRVKRGHHARLRFWFDPMSDDIWNGDADLIMEDELSCDNICTHELFFPIIERFFPGEARCYHSEFFHDTVGKLLGSLSVGKKSFALPEASKKHVICHAFFKKKMPSHWQSGTL